MENNAPFASSTTAPAWHVPAYRPKPRGPPVPCLTLTLGSSPMSRSSWSWYSCAYHCTRLPRLCCGGKVRRRHLPRGTARRYDKGRCVTKGARVPPLKKKTARDYLRLLTAVARRLHVQMHMPAVTCYVISTLGPTLWSVEGSNERAVLCP